MTIEQWILAFDAKEPLIHLFQRFFVFKYVNHGIERCRKCI